MRFNELAPLVLPFFDSEISTSKARTARQMFCLITDYKSDTDSPFYDFADETFRSYFNNGNIRRISKLIYRNLDELKFRNFIDDASGDARGRLAKQIKAGNYTKGVRVDRNTVAKVCTDLFVESINEATGQKSKKSSLKNEKQKFDVRSGAHQFIEYENNKNVIVVDGTTYKISPHLQSNVSEKSEGLLYSNALFEAYSEKLQESINADNVDSSDYAKHYRSQQRFFNEAAWYEHSLRDNVLDFDNQYELLKQDIYDGIEPVYSDEDLGTNGLKRLKEVHKQVVLIQLDRSNLKNIDNILGNDTKKGLCHVLVNDKKIKSWVNVDYDEII
ncbi:ABC-three component system protein [Lactobacillus sp. ESL0703]|uniref:ABC-three component system protein n=1 Tax=Lactobacillus sp. ESL0703 TaxID=2983218 RepID=UPI0023F7B98B|nr:ABC-three component system protein [Lactobacillus sp. ESL0703]MDF7669332.1 hypothetical protein [Lactobacillus sp. ESL0703]